MKLLSGGFNPIGFTSPKNLTNTALRSKVYRMLQIPARHKWVVCHAIGEQCP